MPNMYNQLIIFTQDENGNLARQFISIQDTSSPTDSALAAIVSAYDAVTAARIVGWQKQTTALYAGGLGSSPYPTVFDRAMLNTKSTTQTGKVDVMAPVASMFAADGYTVNLSDSGVMALVAALEDGASVGVAGNAIVQVPSGVRYKVRQGGP